MKQKIKEFSKKYLVGFIIGSILFGTLGVYAVTYFPGLNTTYDNSDSGMTSTNVQDALDELYNVCAPPKTGAETITELLPNKPNELYEDDKGNIRYYGTNPNNYVSFNNELWQIIGVIDGKLKILKYDLMFESWTGYDNVSNNWDKSDLKRYLNVEYYNEIETKYRKMISEETFYLGGASWNNMTTLTASGYYDVERSNSVINGYPTSTKQYIGLMYPSDYGYAAGESCLSTALFKYRDGCKNNDYLFRTDEWLQTPLVSDVSYAASILRWGEVSFNYIVSYSYAIRPTIYLKTEVQITGGTGTQNDPFTISL